MYRLMKGWAPVFNLLSVFGAATVFAAAPSIIVQPVGSIIDEGATLTLSAAALDALGYQWWKNGAALAGATNATLTVAAARMTDSGAYSVAVTNAEGVALSLPAAVTVGSPLLLAWGDNSGGQLGDGTTTGTDHPLGVETGVVAAAAGMYHSLLVKADGTLWSVGAIGDPYFVNCGQLGIGSTTGTDRPVFVASNVVAVAAGYFHSLFVKTDGTLWAMGDNVYGEIGDGTTTEADSPVCVASNVVSASAGFGHSLFIKADGTLWGMGDNTYGQLGMGAETGAALPVCVASNAVSASAGAAHTLFITSDGALWGMGAVDPVGGTYNCGQLGLGSMDGTNVPVRIANAVVSAAAGDSHSVFVTSDGTLWGMGSNAYGQYGDAASGSSDLPVDVASDVVSAGAGLAYSFFFKSDGTLWVVGDDALGQHGDGADSSANGAASQPLCRATAAMAGSGANHVLATGLPQAGVSVVTPVGTANPAAGTYLLDPNSVVTNAMTTPTVISGMTQYVCLGWVATGATPDTGNGTTAVVTVSNVTATLTWLWQTNYWLEVAAGAGGAVAPTSTWVAAGTTTQLVATADDGCTFLRWSGDASGTANPLSVTMDRAKTITAAFFTPPMVTAQPVGQSVAKGGTVTLSATIARALGYQWWKDGARLAGAAGATLTIADAAVADTGVYTLVATNADGAAISLPAVVAVGEPSLLAWGSNDDGQFGNGVAKNANTLPAPVVFDAVTAAAGGMHSLFVKADGTLWAMGGNSYGQLGIGTTESTNRPVFVASNVLVAAAGRYHSLFVKADGTLWAMGYNGYGGLGDGTKTSANVPIRVASNVVAIAAGYYHSLFVKTDGTLWAMGDNGYGELGNGTTTATNVPIRVASNVVAAAAGYYHSLFVKADGALWGMGYNDFGQLGDGTATARKTPVLIASGAVSVAAGYNHTLFVKADGTLWAMGQNDHGQLGNGTTANTNRPVCAASGVVSATAGQYHSLFTKTGGTVWTMGCNTVGQLGDGTTTETHVPVQALCGTPASVKSGAAATHSLAVGTPLAAVTVSTPMGTADPAAGIHIVSLNSVFSNAVNAAVITFGTTQYVCTGWTATGATPASGSGATAVVTVTNTAVALTWVWRTDYWLGVSVSGGGSVAPSSGWVPSGTTPRLTAAADAGCVFKGWSGDASGFGNPLSVLMDRSKAIAALFAVPPSISVQPVGQKVDEGAALTLSATVSNALGCQWRKDGAALAGETNATLTIGSAAMKDTGVYILVATNADAVTISLPAVVTVGDPSLLAWGYNAYGQLGLGTTATTNRPVRVANGVATAAAGGSHSLFVKADGTLWAMGRNDYGQLGLGTATATNRPVQAAENVVFVAAGESFSLYVKTDGTLWTMGRNDYGQLGLGTVSSTNRPSFVASNVVAVAAGDTHALFVKTDGTLWGMGNNSYHQLGDATESSTNLPILVANHAVTVAAGAYHSVFVKADGTLWGMGNNSHLGTTSNSVSPVLIAAGVAAAAAGDRHTLFVKTDGTLWTAGLNFRGQLGNGTTTSTNQPICVASGVANAAGGCLYSLFVKTDGSVWGMGDNGSGSLGVNTTVDSLVPTQALCKAAASVRSGSAAYHTLAIGTPLAAVTVSTLAGMAEPAAGVYSVGLNTVFTNVMTTPTIVNGTTQHVCAGWTLTGGTPASGSGTPAVVTVTNDTATLTWLWQTNYWLDVTAGANGSVAPVSTWVAADTSARLVATADAGYILDVWSGDASGWHNPLSVPMDRPKMIAATFTSAYTAGEHPTSVQWLRDYGISGTATAVENADPDGDGLTTWQEYVAGTDPTNRCSILTVTGCEQVNRAGPNGENAGFAITWPGVAGRVYTLKFCTNLANAVWTDLPGAIGLAGVSPSMTVTDLTAVAANSNCFFKVEVNLPQE